MAGGSNYLRELECTSSHSCTHIPSSLHILRDVQLIIVALRFSLRDLLRIHSARSRSRCTISLHMLVAISLFSWSHHSRASLHFLKANMRVESHAHSGVAAKTLGWEAKPTYMEGNQQVGVPTLGSLPSFVLHTRVRVRNTHDCQKLSKILIP